MNADPVRIVFHLNRSWDLVAVFCSAVEHQASHAGFPTEAGADLARAAGDICRETISQLGGDGDGVDVTLDTFPDRIEVAIHCRGLQPEALEELGASDSDAAAGGVSEQELLSRVDRVLFNAEDGIVRTTLVKFLPNQK